MNLQDIENMDKNVLTPKEVGEILGSAPYAITLQARTDPSKLGFPVIVTGSRTKIPRLAFIRFMKGDLQQEVSI